MVLKRRWWWVACDADEILATLELPTYVRARSRAKAITKAKRRFSPAPEQWEEVEWVTSEGR